MDALRVVQHHPMPGVKLLHRRNGLDERRLLGCNLPIARLKGVARMCKRNLEPPDYYLGRIQDPIFNQITYLAFLRVESNANADAPSSSERTRS